MRFQRFAEVIFTPVVWRDRADGSAHDLVYYPDVEAIVETAAVSADAPGADASLRDDPPFEEAYRAAFVNHEEGKQFRRRTIRPTSGPSTTLLSAGPASAMAPADTLSPESRTESFMAALTPVYKLAVKSKGIYRLSQPYLIGAGTGVAPGLAGADPRLFKMMTQGVELPIRVSGEGDGAFDALDFIEFHGEGIVGEPDATLNLDLDTIGLPGFPDIYQANDVTDENAYFLFAEAGTRARVPDLPAAYNAGFPLDTSFLESTHKEFDTAFVPLGYDDPFFQQIALRPNSGTVVPNTGAANCGYVNPGILTSPLSRKFLAPGFAGDLNHYCPTCELNLPGVVNLPDLATLRLRWRGASALTSSPDHLVVAQVGGTAANYGAHCWDNESFSTQSFTVPQSALIASGVLLESPGLVDDPNRREGAFLDWIEVDYRRSLALSTAELFARVANIDRSYQVDGFPTNSAADMVLWDLSRTVAGSVVPSPRRLTGGTVAGSSGNFNVRFSLTVDGTLAPAALRQVAMAGAGGLKLPVRVTEVTGPNLVDPSIQADYIVIGHPATLDRGPASPFTNYLAMRATESDLTTRIVMIEEIYDQFNNGVAHPEALRAFLSYAFDNWRGPSGTQAAPSYVLLVGDISLDYKNNLARTTAWVNQVPTFILYQESSVLAYFASDNQIAAFRGVDKLPDIHLGRIPVRTLAESNNVFAKLLSYTTSPPAGTWRSKGVFLADKGNSASETGEFERVQSEVADTFFVSPFTNEKLYFDEPAYGSGTNTTLFRSDILARLDAGAALTSYVGHGAFSLWGLQGYFDTSHLSLLAANDKPTFVVNENCLAGGFHTIGSDTSGSDSLGEAFLKADRKGAVAVFAPAGLSFTSTGETINDRLYADMFGTTKERRFGHLITNIRAALSNSITDMQSYVLLGDPAQRLVLPAPRPPVNFQAAGGNAQVTLTWSPGPDPGVTTQIYRTNHPALPYTLLNPGGIAGSVFVDSTVISGNVYYYRASSVIPGPFEGALTNMNTGCNTTNPPASGPDCRWARPLNPNPPGIPSGVTIINPGEGDRLRVTWTPQSEPDVAHHTIHYGAVSGGPYPQSLLVDVFETEAMVLGLTTGTPYYFVLDATNLSGLTSAPSPERSGIPAVFEGINPPLPIADLYARQSLVFADAVELSWTPSAFDIYGGPVTAASYKIYRGATPVFIPSSANLIATISDPAVTVYHDRNAWTLPGPFYYLVTMTDDHGFTSGAGRDLPLGISALDMTKLGNGNLLLSWPAVTVDVMGKITLIDHYELYVDTSPVGRARIDSLTPFITNLTGTSVEIADPGGARFLSIIVVDARGNKSPF